jgi:ribosomal protein S18 acetylase RimI-like enzyme
MTDKILIRNLVEADLYTLSEFLMDPSVLRFYPMSNMTEVQEALKIWLFYARKGYAYTVEVNNKPAGMAILYVNSYQKLAKQSLFAIVMGEKYRGKGIGTKLLTHLMKEAKYTYGILNLHLEVYENNPAYSLYERLGFKQYAVHENFMREQNSDKKNKKIMMQINLKETAI